MDWFDVLKKKKKPRSLKQPSKKQLAAEAKMKAMLEQSVETETDEAAMTAWAARPRVEVETRLCPRTGQQVRIASKGGDASVSLPPATSCAAIVAAAGRVPRARGRWGEDGGQADAAPAHFRIITPHRATVGTPGRCCGTAAVRHGWCRRTSGGD